MSEQLTAWIRRVAALNDSDLEEELKLVNKNSLNAFARAISRIRRPELDSHTYRNGPPSPPLEQFLSAKM